VGNSFTNLYVSTLVFVVMSANGNGNGYGYQQVTRKPADVVHGWYLGHHHNTCDQCNLSSHTLYTTPLSHVSLGVLFQVEQLSLPGGVPTVPADPKLVYADQKNSTHRCTNSGEWSFPPRDRCLD